MDEIENHPNRMYLSRVRDEIGELLLRLRNPSLPQSRKRRLLRILGVKLRQYYDLKVKYKEKDSGASY
jgi:hypothetical protein